MSTDKSDIRVHPYYHEARNEIVQPGHFVACSRYFVQKWIPLLGGTGAALVLYLRSMGYFNPRTGELRNGVQVSLKDIARACACSDRTIQRELEKNEALRKFVQVESCYERDDAGNIRRLENIYRIAMDDPIVDEDQPVLLEIIAAREQERLRAAAPRASSRVRHARRAASQPTHTPIHDILSPTEITPNSIDDRMSPIEPPAPSRTRQSDTTLATDCRINNMEEATRNTYNNSMSTHPAPVPPTLDAVVVELIEKLTGHGVTRRTAESLTTEYSSDRVQRQLLALPYRSAKDPARVLVASIRDDWEMPAGCVEDRQSEADVVSTAAEQAELARRDTERRDRLDQLWNGLSTDDQSAINAEAIERLRRENAFLANRLLSGRPSVVLDATIDAIRNDILSIMITSNSSDKL